MAGWAWWSKALRGAARALPALACALLVTAGASAAEPLWERLREGGYIILMRHAATEDGVGDPPAMRLDDCATQRNLSAAGRAQAARLAELFRAQRVPVGEVRASPWCRCLDTARLAFGEPRPWDALASLYHDASRAAQQRAAVLAAARAVQPPGNAAWVTHAYNIRAWTGVAPASAEIVVARAGADGLEVVGRIAPP